MVSIHLAIDLSLLMTTTEVIKASLEYKSGAIKCSIYHCSSLISYCGSQSPSTLPCNPNNKERHPKDNSSCILLEEVLPNEHTSTLKANQLTTRP